MCGGGWGEEGWRGGGVAPTGVTQDCGEWGVLATAGGAIGTTPVAVCGGYCALLITRLVGQVVQERGDWSGAVCGEGERLVGIILWLWESLHGAL